MASSALDQKQLSDQHTLCPAAVTGIKADTNAPLPERKIMLRDALAVGVALLLVLLAFNSFAPFGVRTRQGSSRRQLRFGSWNVRYDGQARNPVPIRDVPDPTKRKKGHGQGGYGERPWSERRWKVADSVLWEDLDVVGFQEALTTQVDDLAVLLGDGFAWIGVGRDDGVKVSCRGGTEAAGRTRLRLLSAEHFWLSETPSIPGSKSWDAGQTRMVTLAKFHDRSPTPQPERDYAFRRWSLSNLLVPRPVPSHRIVYVLNTHWDERGVESRSESAKVILRRVDELLSLPENEGALIVLLGDLNSPSEEEGYRTLTGHHYDSPARAMGLQDATAPRAVFRDTRREVLLRGPRSHSGGTQLLYGPFGESKSFTGFERGSHEGLIDFVMYAEDGRRKGPAAAEWRVDRVGVVPNRFDDDGQGGILASDHRLVVASLERVE